MSFTLFPGAPGTAETTVSHVGTAPCINIAWIWVPSSMLLKTNKFLE